MSKRRRRNPSNKFVMLERWFWRCPAWQALPHLARSLYVELEMLYSGDNNGALYLSIRDAAKRLRTGPRQAQAAFHELESGGFIRATRKGSRTRRGEQQLASSWCLTKHPDDVSGHPATTDFMKPPQKNLSVSPEDTERVPIGHATPQKQPEKRLERIPRGHAQATFEASSVSPEDTHLIYHLPAQRSGAQRATPRIKAAWLRDHLATGILTPDAVAAVLAIRPNEVEPIAAGKIRLANPSWEMLAALVASRTN